MAAMERGDGDYVDAVHPGLKHVLNAAANVTGPITDLSQLGGALEEKWACASKLLVLNLWIEKTDYHSRDNSTKRYIY